MSFDKPTRNKLAAMVGDCRRLLTDDIHDQLQRTYGLQPDGTALPVERLAHLDELGQQVARELREWQEYLASTEVGTEAEKKKSAFDRVAHENAFTVLNRLAALRMCEERGHILECVRRGMESDAFVLYERLSGGVFGTRSETYRIFLDRMFDELAVDLGVLFDRRAPQSLVFPRERCLEDVLSLLNRQELTHLWKADETIGWIYQYFNSKEEREVMRAASAAPRNSRELAVRNQFFTPRYVVEFLVDNTLARIWYEMRKGHTVLKDACGYLVRRPTEIFLKHGEQAPASSNAEANLSQEEQLLKHPVYIPHRPKKDPRDLRILDPAVGSGHFLLYAFDLLETIYEEAWADEHPVKSETTGKTLREEYADLDTMKRALPELIVRHNLHGIDIDLRACQIAALALWLRSQRTYQQLGLKPAERPRITKSNVVCAEPMPGERQLLDQFVADLQPRVLGQLVKVVFEKMKLAGETGSLLKIEEEIADAVADAKKKWLIGPKPEQTFLFGDLHPQQTELGLDFSGITDTTFWEKAEERIYAELRNYAERAENGHGYQRRLFADDAARGFAFIDVCRKRYTAVLMNPPFGEPAKASIEYINERYPTAFIDLLAAFVERTATLASGGRVGALTSRACLYTKTLTDWRRNKFLPSIEHLTDLGGGVLDGAMVFACASVFASPSSTDPNCIAFDLRNSADRGTDLASLIASVGKGQPTENTYSNNRLQLSSINNSRFLYNIPDAFWRWSHDSKTLVQAGGAARAGSTTYDDFRFLRLSWEVPLEQLGWAKTWVYFSKGGYFETFYNDIHLLVNWQGNGREVGEFNRIGYGTDAQSKRASSFYKLPGITYPRRTIKGFSPRVLPKDCIFADKGPVIFAPKETNLRFALGYWNAGPIRALVHLQVQAGSFETGVVNSIPWLESESASDEVSDLASQVWRSKAEIYRLSEVDRGFVSPALGMSFSIRSLSEHLCTRLSTNSQLAVERTKRISECISKAFALPEIDTEAFEVSPDDHAIQEDFGISHSPAFFVLQLALGFAFGRWDVRFATGDKATPELPDPFAALPVCPPGMLQNEEGLPLTHGDVERLQASGNLDYPLQLPWDGILVDDEDHPRDIARRASAVLGVIWKDREEAIEQEACEILGVKDLREYFRKPTLFFADHLSGYSKSRRQAPIYWPLSTPSGSYTLWIYHHRLNDDSLYTALNKYVKPKIDATEKELRRIESELPNATGREASDLRTAFERATSLLEELREFRADLARIAELPYKPNLNDGVLIAASPLWKLFRLPQWRKDLQECWKRLETGEYDWAHLAYSIWPDRVREVCKRDRSIAIAHGLEELCEVTAKPAKKKGTKKSKVEETVPGDEK